MLSLGGELPGWGSVPETWAILVQPTIPGTPFQTGGRTYLSFPVLSLLEPMGRRGGRALLEDSTFLIWEVGGGDKPPRGQK